MDYAITHFQLYQVDKTADVKAKAAIILGDALKISNIQVLHTFGQPYVRFPDGFYPLDVAIRIKLETAVLTAYEAA